MKKLTFLSFSLMIYCATYGQNVKALVGGTLIDGFGSTPIQNSVIIIEGERITAVGNVDNIEIPPNAEIIS